MILLRRATRGSWAWWEAKRLQGKHVRLVRPLPGLRQGSIGIVDAPARIDVARGGTRSTEWCITIACGREATLTRYPPRRFTKDEFAAHLALAEAKEGRP